MLYFTLLDDRTSSVVYDVKRSGPRTDPGGTPYGSVCVSENLLGAMVAEW